MVTKVSQATLDSGSKAKKLSISASLIWSATLSGCPSDTLSDVNKYAINNKCNITKGFDESVKGSLHCPLAFFNEVAISQISPLNLATNVQIKL